MYVVILLTELNKLILFYRNRPFYSKVQTAANGWTRKVLFFSFLFFFSRSPLPSSRVKHSTAIQCLCQTPRTFTPFWTLGVNWQQIFWHVFLSRWTKPSERDDSPPQPCQVQMILTRHISPVTSLLPPGYRGPEVVRNMANPSSLIPNPRRPIVHLPDCDGWQACRVCRSKGKWAANWYLPVHSGAYNFACLHRTVAWPLERVALILQRPVCE